MREIAILSDARDLGVAASRRIHIRSRREQSRATDRRPRNVLLSRRSTSVSRLIRQSNRRPIGPSHTRTAAVLPRVIYARCLSDPFKRLTKSVHSLRSRNDSTRFVPRPGMQRRVIYRMSPEEIAGFSRTIRIFRYSS